jgi:hypothetical protein
METTELQYILDRGIWLKKLHGKVCAKDKLPSKKPLDVRAYIIHTDSSDQPGEHWIAIVFDQKNEAIYFDSYGLPPQQQEIVSFMTNNSNKWSFNKQRLQGVFSTVCGLYCLFVLQTAAQGNNSQHCLQETFSSTDYFKNDTNVSIWFNQHFGALHQEEQKQSDQCQCCKPQQHHHAMSLHFPHMLVCGPNITN